MGGASRIERVVAVNVNWNSNDREWNLNANDLDDNRWNDGNCVLSRSLPLPSPRYRGEVFSESCRNHPPSILPASSSFSESRMYFLVSSAFISQEI